MKRDSSLHYASILSPLGEVWLAKTMRGLCRVHFGLGEVDWVEMLAREMGSAPRPDPDRFLGISQQFSEYFEGRRRSFNVPLDLTSGSPFQRRVWAVTRRIPYGQVRSYGEIARAVGASKAARAVGGALGANPVPIVVPCHRVLRTDGTLGGFAAGLEIKRALLTLEGYTDS